MPENDARVRDLFLQALDQHADQVADFLDKTCGDDAELRKRVQELLDAHNQAGNFLAPSHMDETIIKDPEDPEFGDSPRDSPRDSTAATPQPGTIIGPYKLLEPIGEGGMGAVWLASQSKPIKRKVAIKLIKAGMDSRQVLTRFEAERQALAMMDHPNIARVLDGGMTEQGRPYFAMEFVKGVPLTEYCNQVKLSLRERLELFLPICQAVQHAHQKGIIHRDLKPSNILVCQYDGKPVPKVIDFGLAKAMHHSLTEQSLHTAYGTVVGTPLYMSPEQAEQNNLDIDTRTDVYALGVILYELLTGTTPLEKAQMKDAAYGEVLRLIKEVEPPKPSTRLSGSESLPSVAAQRSIDPAHLTRSITGDLDWVVMKALEKERSRRYETANGLAEDIRRHLSDEPVSAGPPSTRYRLRKFIRRNRAGVIAASAIAVALLLGVVGTTTGMIWAFSEKEIAVNARQAASEAKLEAEQNAKRAHDEATRATTAERETSETLKEVEAERDAKELALREAEQISDFLTNVFQSPDPEKDGRELRVVELLDRAAKKLESDLADLPGQRARIQATLAHTYYTLGLQRQAIPLAEQARDYYVETLGPRHLETLKMMEKLALYYHHDSRRPEALKLLIECYETSRAVLGPQHSHSLKTMNHLSFIHFMNGHHDEATRLREEAVEILRSKLGDEHLDTLEARSNLASSYFHTGNRKEGLRQREELLEICQRTLGEANPLTLRVMQNLAVSYQATRQRSKALQLAEERLAICRAAFGESHLHTLSAMSAVAGSYRMIGRKDDSLKLHQKVLLLSRKALGTEHWLTITTMQELAARLHGDTDRDEQAQSLREELLLIRIKKLSSVHLSTYKMMDSITFSALTIAATQVWEQRLEEYGKLTSQLLDIAIESELTVVLERVAKIASLAPHADIATRKNALQLARKAMELGKNDKHFQRWGRMTLGMALYRTGNFAEAEEVLSAERSNAGLIGGTATFFRVMSLFQQKKEQAARDLFAAAKEKMTPLPKDGANPLKGIDADQIIVWLAYKEAAAMLNQ